MKDLKEWIEDEIKRCKELEEKSCEGYRNYLKGGRDGYKDTLRKIENLGYIGK